MASSREGAPGLERARAAGVETAVFAIAEHPDREARDAALGEWLAEREVDLVVLAGSWSCSGPTSSAASGAGS